MIGHSYLFGNPFLDITEADLPATLLKKRHWHRLFPVNFAKFLRTPLVAVSDILMVRHFLFFIVTYVKIFVRYEIFVTVYFATFRYFQIYPAFHVSSHVPKFEADLLSFTLFSFLIK